MECRQKAAYVEKTAHIASAVSEMRGKSIDFLDAVPIKPIVKTMFGFDERVELFSHLVMLHSVLPLHFDYPGVVGTEQGNGLGRNIVAIQLCGESSYVFIQEEPSCIVSSQRFPFVVYFKVSTGDVWALTGSSRFFTNHEVFPSRLPLNGNGQLLTHGVNCDRCRMSLVLRFGDVSRSEWEGYEKSK